MTKKRKPRKGKRIPRKTFLKLLDPKEANQKITGLYKRLLGIRHTETAPQEDEDNLKLLISGDINLKDTKTTLYAIRSTIKQYKLKPYLILHRKISYGADYIAHYYAHQAQKPTKPITFYTQPTTCHKLLASQCDKAIILTTHPSPSNLTKNLLTHLKQLKKPTYLRHITSNSSPPNPIDHKDIENALKREIDKARKSPTKPLNQLIKELKKEKKLD